MRIESGAFFQDPRKEVRGGLSVDAIILDKDLTLTEEAEEDDPRGITLSAKTLFWSQRVRMIDETHRFLSEAYDAGLKIGLLTNDLRAPTNEVLDRFNLTHYFKVVVAREEVNGERKPHPSTFQYMAEQLGVQPERCVMIGDEPRDDIFGAQRAGMKTILTPRWEHVQYSSEWNTPPNIVLLGRHSLNMRTLTEL